MAILKSEGLGFEFKYADLKYGWIDYQFRFLWRGEPLVNDRVLKRLGPYWGGRPACTFLAMEDEPDGLLKMLRKGLAADEMSYWEPVDPDITVALYPDDYFPFLTTPYAEKQRQPGDYFTLIILANVYNFKGEDAYGGQGLALHMVSARHELEAFTDQLEKESSSFKRKYGLDELPEENG
jgi:hypothetical protein